MLTGIFSTLLITETKQKSLEELSNETQDGFIEGMWSTIVSRRRPIHSCAIGVVAEQAAGKV